MLYFDFSGYTDMAIGLAWMVGLRFPDNFDQPYRATSVIAYWQRWHMSLTRFLMTNVHAPLTLAVMRWRKRQRPAASIRPAQRTVGRLRRHDRDAARGDHGAGRAVARRDLPSWLFGAAARGVPDGQPRSGACAQAPPLPKHRQHRADLSLRPGRRRVVSRRHDLADAGVDAWRHDRPAWHALRCSAGPSHGAVDVLWLVGLYAHRLVRSVHPPVDAGRPDPAVWPGQPSPQWAVVMGCAATLGLLAAGGTGEFLYFRF